MTGHVPLAILPAPVPPRWMPSALSRLSYAAGFTWWYYEASVPVLGASLQPALLASTVSASAFWSGAEDMPTDESGRPRGLFRRGDKITVCASDAIVELVWQGAPEELVVFDQLMPIAATRAAVRAAAQAAESPDV